MKTVPPAAGKNPARRLRCRAGAGRRLCRAGRAAAAVAAPAPDGGQSLRRAQGRPRGPHLVAAHGDHRSPGDPLAHHHPHLPGGQPVSHQPVRRAVARRSRASELASTAPTGAPSRGFLRGCAARRADRAQVSQNQATYAVEVVNQRGRSAGLSNQVRIPLVPTAPPPTGFRATLDAQGPLLQWDDASSFTPASDVSCVLRIYRRASASGAASVAAYPTGQSSTPPKPGARTHAPAPPEFALIAEQPYRLGPGEARDSSFEWEQEYDYKIAAVTVSPPRTAGSRGGRR